MVEKVQYVLLLTGTIVLLTNWLSEMILHKRSSEALPPEYELLTWIDQAIDIEHYIMDLCIIYYASLLVTPS